MRVGWLQGGELLYEGCCLYPRYLGLSPLCVDVGAYMFEVESCNQNSVEVVREEVRAAKAGSAENLRQTFTLCCTGRI